MRSRPPRKTAVQLALVPPPPPAPAEPSRRPRGGRNARMAARLEGQADAATREAFAAYAQGDEISARAAEDRAIAARRAAAILRAGPGHVGDLLAS